MKLIAIRDGDYDMVAPGLFSDEFDKPLVANLIDTTARDLAEVMAPMPVVSCQSASMSKEADVQRQDKRSAIANSYVQASRLQDQRFGGADRFGSFGFMAYIVEPDFKRQTPVIRIDDNATAHYTLDYMGRTKEYVSIGLMNIDAVCLQFPDFADRIKARYGQWNAINSVEVARYYDETHEKLILLDPAIVLASVEHKVSRCPIRIVERPKLTGQAREKGQFDDVIWVQVARALVAQYTINALEESVNAPLQVPTDVNALEIGPKSVLQTDGQVQRVNLQISPGLFPEQALLAQEQRLGSRYPEGRSGSIDASIITGQGVQALMGTFDTQVQTFQRLDSSALEDVIALCFEMDEAYWGDTKKTIRIKDNGAPRKVDYVPNKDINGDHTVDVSYGAIAGLDPNRGLVFILQALAGGLISKTTARKYLPVDLNPLAEERQITIEALHEATAGTISIFPQLLLQMQQMGQDPRDMVMQLAELKKRLERGDDPVEAMEKVFAPKEDPAAQQAPVDPMQQAIEQAMGGGGAPAGGPAMPGAGEGGASDMLMMLAGISPGGSPQMGASVSRMQPVA
jgi:hypothetical protein